MASERKYLITVIGASGHQGSTLVPLFYNNDDFFCRLVVHSDSSRKRLQITYPKAEVMQADLLQPSDVTSLFFNATHYWHMSPPFDPNEVRAGQICIDAARSESARQGNRFQHLIYSSVLGSQLSKLVHHAPKLRMEEMVMESGVNYTIVQPVNLLEYIPIAEIARTGVYRAMNNPDVRQSVLTTKDLAEAVYKIATQGDKHYYAVYALVSSLPITYRDIMKILADAVGKRIDVEFDGFDRARESMIRARLGDNPNPHKLDAMERMLLYYNRYGSCGNPMVLEWLLGRKPTSVEEWAKDQTKSLS